MRVCEIEEVPGQAARELSVGNGRSRHVATGDCWEAKNCWDAPGFLGVLMPSSNQNLDVAGKSRAKVP